MPSNAKLKSPESGPPRTDGTIRIGAGGVPDARLVEAMPCTDAVATAPPAVTSAAPPILVIDLGGTKVKILATGQTEPRKTASGKDFTPAQLVETVEELAGGW